ncbi:hypothetical protein BMT55_16710 [Listeria newyorkensis]|uniref:FtsK gamma domain-containing protein n=1 Tax=Listeria newyorkensis TaxID=1497681 RepID=A0ABX4XID3_9LIST|nr:MULTISPECIES: DNA translocase FtsK [Listeria]KGL45709.1 hypothetical protein EP58_03180 [Listeria newyorkensis]PNP86909.1 hypothetical protein BMT55_16710 [Listeria newyorkensis]RQW66685.1 hypothetical protein DUK53_08590 [Listeria sp. SHR_NRA_18]WAO23180.1 DNA translocase FtsK [Listeria newyorkensis]SQC55359.1 Ftsk gamma domain [Listeria newyorkensis]
MTNIDELYEEAVQLVRKHGEVSQHLIRVKFRLGENSSQKLLDKLESGEVIKKTGDGTWDVVNVFKIEEQTQQVAVRDGDGHIITIIPRWSEYSAFISFFTKAYEGDHWSMMNTEINERVNSGEWALLGEGEA